MNNPENKLVVMDVFISQLANDATSTEIFAALEKKIRVERIRVNSSNCKINLKFGQEELFENKIPGEELNAIFDETLRGHLILSGKTNSATIQNDSGGTLDYHVVITGYEIH
jgi:hypothetical protein